MSNRRRLRGEFLPPNQASISLALSMAAVSAKADGKPEPVMTRRWARAMRPRQLVAARTLDHHQPHHPAANCGPSCHGSA